MVRSWRTSSLGSHSGRGGETTKGRGLTKTGLKWPMHKAPKRCGLLLQRARRGEPTPRIVEEPETSPIGLCVLEVFATSIRHLSERNPFRITPDGDP